MNDKALRQDITDELDWDPSIDSANIGVAVDNGVVTLTGHVPNYAQKSTVETVVRRVKGVRAIAEEIKVRLDGSDPYSDDDIARRACTVLDLNLLVPIGAIKVKAQQGWLTLTGELDWDYQRKAAIDDLRKLRGVVGITNSVTLKVRVSAGDVVDRIKQALKRDAEIEASDVHVRVHNGKVTLDGKVDSWSDRQTAERAAWSAPGVHAVEDHLHLA